MIRSYSRDSVRGSVVSYASKHSELSVLSALEPREVFLANIYAEEEEEMIVYEIREEILQKTMHQIQQNYIKRQRINFFVHCSIKAMIQALDLYFFYHNDMLENFKKDPVWQFDEPPQPSIADSWSGHLLPTISQNELKTESSLSDNAMRSVTCASEELKFDQSGDKILKSSHEFIDMEDDDSGSSATLSDEDKQEIDALDSKDSKSKSDQNIFMRLVYADTNICLEKNNVLSAQQKKYATRQMSTVFKIKQSPPAPTTLEKLPGIRCDATCKSLPPEEKKPSSSKKKKRH